MVHDQLPSGLSSPSNLQVNVGKAYFDEAHNTIHWSGNPSEDEIINLSYETTVMVDGPQLLINSARLFDQTEQLGSDEFYLFVDPYNFYLPMISQ